MTRRRQIAAEGQKDRYPSEERWRTRTLQNRKPSVEKWRIAGAGEESFGGKAMDERCRTESLQKRSGGRTLYRRKSQVDNNDKRFVLHENTKIVSGE